MARKDPWLDAEPLTEPAPEPTEERGPKQPSANAKEVSFIISDRRYHRHATMKSAQIERSHLTKLYGKTFRILRVLNIAKGRVPLYEGATELRETLAKLLDVSKGMTAWASGPAAWERMMAEYEPIRDAAQALLDKTGGSNGQG